MLKRLKAVWEQRKHTIIFMLITLLYSLGGGGWKALRRYGIPITICLMLINKNVLRFVLSLTLLAIPLHFGYTPIVDGLNWGAMALLGAAMGLSWVAISYKKTPYLMLLMAATFPVSVYLNKCLGLNWQFSELIVGAGYGVSYLIARGDDEL